MFGVTPFNRNTPTRKNEPRTWSDLIDDFFRDDFFPMRNLRYDTFKVDIKEEEQQFIVEADLPGVKKENIKLDYHDGLLSIHIEQEESKEEESKNYVHRERRLSTMERHLNLGELDIEKIEANLIDGVLTIKAPKLAVVESKKRIEIK